MSVISQFFKKVKLKYFFKPLDALLVNRLGGRILVKCNTWDTTGAGLLFAGLN